MTLVSISEDTELSFGLTFTKLYEHDGLSCLDSIYCAWLRKKDISLFNRLMQARAMIGNFAVKDESALLIELAPSFEEFIAALFKIEKDLANLTYQQEGLAPIARVKRLFVQRYAAKALSYDEIEKINPFSLEQSLGLYITAEVDLFAFELDFACRLEELLGPELRVCNVPEADLRPYTEYAAWALFSAAGRFRHAGGLLFRQPKKTPDASHLVAVSTETVSGITRMRLDVGHTFRQRDGFALTDSGISLAGALDQANYCIWCHKQGKDSCSRGLKEKSGAYRSNSQGVTLAGCPLEEKISEFNLLKASNHPLAALAVIIIDNPMLAATGHRICNDCMKACIYQKQQPVDIPQIETRTLKDILELPFGFEIYSLLTRWNPLNFRRPLPKPASGRSVLVVGLGPAGFTLAHHLLNDGHSVFAIDGLKIEPLAPDLSGVNSQGEQQPFVPIRDIAALREPLEERTMSGFGGVTEYGITVRWDKNFLKIIRLLLERRSEFAMYGGVRFGGNMTIDQAFGLGFDHIALCTGAGRPTVLPILNGLARGVRQASDFLMSLQLTGAARKDSVANLQIRLPIVVIGGGLTAVDTATEALAYYPVQVEKFLDRYESLVAICGEETIESGWNEEDREIANEFLFHARALRSERLAAAKDGRALSFIPLLQQWGGVTIIYRRNLCEAPSYILNHEEVEKALEEGIFIAESLTPTSVSIDRFGAVEAIVVTHNGEIDKGDESIMPVRTILVAAGTQPNTVLAREYPNQLTLNGRYFQAIDEDGVPVTPQKLTKPRDVYVLAQLSSDGRAVSFFGDLHPSFAGNVVKAMSSAKQGYPVISRILERRTTLGRPAFAIRSELDYGLRPIVERVTRLTPSIIEIEIRAPFAAKAFYPGQFFRLQNFESLASSKCNTRLAIEGLALTGATVDKDKGLLSLIVLEIGGSSSLVQQLRPGEPVVLMGPTGMPTVTKDGETLMLVGGGLGNAVLFSIGQDHRRRGGSVIYFAGYKKVIDRYKVEEIEKAADLIIWCCDESPGFRATRSQDLSFVGNIVEAMEAYGQGRLGKCAIPLTNCTRVIAIGSDRMMAAVAMARHHRLANYLSPDHVAIGSINSPMQCMMKEICAQCLQRHIDPDTGLETVVFSCSDQDQPLDRVDWMNLNSRLLQNALSEKLTHSWIRNIIKD